MRQLNHLKKLSAGILILCSTLFVLSSCSSSSSVEKDAKEIATASCDLQKFVLKYNEPPEPGTPEHKELERLEEKVEKLTEAFEKKYGDPEENKELAERITKAIKDIIMNCGK